MLTLFACALLVASFGLNSASVAFSERADLIEKQGALLEQIILQRNISSCVFVLTDATYKRLLASAKINEATPLFAETVARNTSALRALIRAKAQGCRLFALFLSNTKKLAQLLRAADRLRLIGSEVLLLLPFDARLFTLKMHDLWRRLQNVVFVGTAPERRSLGRRCLLVRTVKSLAPVDADHPETWIPPPVALWCSGAVPSTLFADKTRDLKGEILRAAYFQNPPAVEVVSSSKHAVARAQQFKGIEVELFQLFAERVNATPLLSEVSNGSAGVAEAVDTAGFDIGLGTLANLPELKEHCDLSTPYATMCYTFLSPEKRGDLKWRTLVLPFESILWIFSATALFICWLSILMIARFQMEKSSLQGVQESILITLSVQLLVPAVRWPSGWPLRTLFYAFWMHSLLLGVAYRSSFAAQLARPPPTIAPGDSLQKLAFSNMRLLTFEPFARDMFAEAPDMSSQLVAKRIELVNASEVAEIVSQVQRGSAAFFGNVRFLQSLHAGAEINGGGVHVNAECVVALPVSIGVARGSALAPRLSRVVKRAIEVGLVARWLRADSRRPPEPPPAASIDLPKVGSVLAVLACGHLAAGAIFLFEIILGGRKKKSRF